MTKKKPDFLRDLDTAIMDELTGGGIKGNAAGLVGTLTQITLLHLMRHTFYMSLRTAQRFTKE